MASRKFGVLMQHEFWRYFNLVDCSLQHMKLCSFIILAAFKFGVMDLIRQIAKLKSSSKFQRIWYCKLNTWYCFILQDYTVLKFIATYVASVYIQVNNHMDDIKGIIRLEKPCKYICMSVVWLRSWFICGLYAKEFNMNICAHSHTFY